MFTLVQRWDWKVMTPEEMKVYRAWKSIKQRCNNPSCTGYHHYGGRGIKFFQPWQDSLIAFAEGVGMPPTLEHELDRKNTNGNYEPGNVRWITHTENMRNIRSNVHVTINGVTKLSSQWADEIGVSRPTFHQRLKKGFTGEKLLLKPYDSRRKMVTIDGETKSVSEWAMIAGLSITGFSERMARGDTGQALIRRSRKQLG